MIVPMCSDNDLLTLTLTPDNVVNCTLTGDNGKVYYTVMTEHTDKTSYTQVRDLQDDVIGSLEWREILPDKVTIGRAKTVSLGDWMKKSLIPFKDEASFSDDSKRGYKWKGLSVGRSLELYTADDKYTNPIARFHRKRRVPYPKASGSQDWVPSKLVLDKRAQEIRDLVVMSFLFLEKSHRTNETSSMNSADVLGTINFKPLGSDYYIRNGGV